MIFIIMMDIRRCDCMHASIPTAHTFIFKCSTVFTQTHKCHLLGSFLKPCKRGAHFILAFLYSSLWFVITCFNQEWSPQASLIHTCLLKNMMKVKCLCLFFHITEDGLFNTRGLYDLCLSFQKNHPCGMEYDKTRLNIILNGCF